MLVENLVSAIIPTHNRAAMTAQAVKSVLEQDYRPVEILVVDDGSSPEEARVLESVAAAHPEVKLLRQANGGPGAARECGRLAAQGEFIQYLDSDDLLLPGKFSAQVAALRGEPTCDVAYGMTRFRKADGLYFEGAWKGSGARIESMFPSFLVSRWWDTPNPLYRRSICDRAGPWLTTWMEEDWEYDCRIAGLGARLAYVPAFVCEVRDHGGSRLSRHGLDPSRLSDRARAHERIFAHALCAKIPVDSPEMLHFSRALFLLARQCAAAGLEHEAFSLFSLAREASGPARANGWDFRLVALAVRLFGWRRAGRASAAFDRLRP